MYTMAQTEGRLLADVGGTNVRFAWQSARGADLESVHVMPCDEHNDLASAMRLYLRLRGDCKSKPTDCAIAIATSMAGDEVAMTNRNWRFSVRALQTEFGFRHLVILNDFAALALGVLDVPRSELRQVGGGTALPDHPIGVLGPGTGLGVSGLVSGAKGVWHALSGEGGHVTLAGSTALERAVVELLASRHSHVSAERVLSGAGLVELHRCISYMHGIEPETLTAAEITQRALTSSQELCCEALDMFCAFLGVVAGNLALTLGAQGGIYIGGGIVPRWGAFLDASPFRNRFEDKGRFTSYLRNIPTLVIESGDSPALSGAARALDTLV